MMQNYDTAMSKSDIPYKFLRFSMKIKAFLVFASLNISILSIERLDFYR